MTGEISGIAFEKAFLKAQMAMSHAPKSGNNPHFRSKYANYEDVVDCVKPALNANGITYRHTSRPTPEGWYIGTVLIHADSGFSTEPFEMLCPTGKMQENGSSMSYAKRYTLQSICGVASGDDDDGTLAQKMPEVKKTPQANTLPRLTHRMKTLESELYNKTDLNAAEKLEEYLSSKGVDKTLWVGISDKLHGKKKSEISKIIEQLDPASLVK